MKLWIAIVTALTLALAGCSADGGFTGSPHAVQGKVSTPLVDMDIVPTVVPDGGKPMGYRGDGVEDIYTTYDDGTVSATGRAAWALSLARLCATAPRSPYCGSPP